MACHKVSNTGYAEGYNEGYEYKIMRKAAGVKFFME
jgi:hypothetical protein